jgi:hypothetical protein
MAMYPNNGNSVGSVKVTLYFDDFSDAPLKATKKVSPRLQQSADWGEILTMYLIPQNYAFVGCFLGNNTKK